MTDCDLRCRQLCVLLASAALLVLAGTRSTVLAQHAVQEAIEKTLGQVGEKAEPPSPEVPIDEYGRGTPRGAVEGYREAVGRRDYQRAANYLDLRGLPEKDREERGAELARQIQAIVEPTLWIDSEAVSDQPAGYTNDGLPPYRDRLGRIETPDGKTVDFFLQRVPRGDGIFIWKAAAVTVAQIPKLYELFGYGILDEIAPRFLLDTKLARAPLLEWVAIVVMAGLALGATYLLTLVALRLLRWWQARPTPLSQLLAGPVRLVLWLPVFWLMTKTLTFSISPRIVLYAVERAILTVALAWTAARLVDVFAHMLSDRLHRTGRTGAISLLSPGRKTAKVLIAVVAVIAALQSFGFNVTALVAGLGVGGVAVALASQKTLENFIAGITLYADRPVKVGDFCRFGDQLGTVEEIGLRSTRVRTLDRTLLAVPNAEFSNLQLDNFTRRDKIWYHPRISLRYETTPDQIRYVLIEVAKMLYGHPKVEPNDARIRFAGFGAYSLDLDIFAYVQVTDYAEYLGVAEDLNLRIMDIVSAAGTRLAVPAQTHYVENGPGVDREAAEEIGSKVTQWRTQQELYLPRFPHERIRELRSTLDYPPQGSPTA